MKKKICIVSNNPKILNKAEKCLKEIGYSTKTFNSFIQISNTIKSQKFDLLIFDLSAAQNLAGEYIHELKSISLNQSLPVIAISDTVSEIERIINQEQCIVDFILKPFHSSLLIAHVRSLFSRVAFIESNFENELNKIRQNISSIIPHEFRTSISGILGFSNLLINGIKAIENGNLSKLKELSEMAQAIRLSGEHLNRITENFLLYSQLNSAILGSERFNIKENAMQMSSIEVITDVISSVQNRILEQNFKVSLDIEEGVLNIDYIHFFKIIYELLDNSIKFSKPSSKIIIKGRNYEKFYNISISDEGRGMDKSQIEQIGAYKQFDRNIYEQQGAGLGLAIVSQIIEIYDGTLNIQSAKGKGCTVHLAIPIAVDASKSLDPRLYDQININLLSEA